MFDQNDNCATDGKHKLKEAQSPASASCVMFLVECVWTLNYFTHETAAASPLINVLPQGW